MSPHTAIPKRRFCTDRTKNKLLSRVVIIAESRWTRNVRPKWRAEAVNICCRNFGITGHESTEPSPCLRSGPCGLRKGGTSPPDSASGARRSWKSKPTRRIEKGGFPFLCVTVVLAEALRSPLIPDVSKGCYTTSCRVKSSPYTGE